jgi:acyl-coenzyme A thioesterase PaaI-like protein
MTDFVVQDEVEIDLPFRDDLTQHHGYFAGAALAATVDVACGYAAMTLMPSGVSNDGAACCGWSLASSSKSATRRWCRDDYADVAHIVAADVRIELTVATGIHSFARR